MGCNTLGNLGRRNEMGTWSKVKEIKKKIGAFVFHETGLISM